MNIEEINQLLGINTVDNPFAQNQAAQNTKENKPSAVKNFDISSILNRTDKEEEIEILGELFDDQNFSF